MANRVFLFILILLTGLLRLPGLLSDRPHPSPPADHQVLRLSPISGPLHSFKVPKVFFYLFIPAPPSQLQLYRLRLAAHTKDRDRR